MEKIGHYAQVAVERLLKRSDRWHRALLDAALGTPLHVQRLDFDDRYYYIVPYRTGRRETARIIVDASTGRFAQAGGVEKRTASLTPYITDPVQELIERHGPALDLPGVGKRTIRPGTVGLHPVLVWMPCRQSMSPFVPFYQMSVYHRLVYLRADGRGLFYSLTTGPA